MNMKYACASALALMLAVPAQSARADTVLINEGFDDVSSLAAKGWVLDNRSSPLGSLPGYYQGQDYIFPALAGPSNSYAASSYNAALQGGSIADWLITSAFSTKEDGTASFWVRSELADGFTDYFSYGFSSGGTATADFPLTRAAIVPGEWTQFSVSFKGTGQDTVGRLAIVHVGLADTANYMGVNTVVISTVPEPSAPLLLGAGLLTLTLLRRRAAR